MRGSWREKGEVPEPDRGDPLAHRVTVGIVRGDRVIGMDDGVLFRGENGVGFIGASTTFLIPYGSFQIVPGGLGGGLLALGVPDDDLVLGMRTRERHVTAGSDRLKAFLLAAEKVPPSRSEAEWPPLEDGPRASRRTLTQGERLITTALVTWAVLCTVPIPATMIFVTGELPWTFWPFLLLGPLFFVFGRNARANTRRAAEDQLRVLPIWLVMVPALLPAFLHFIDLWHGKGLAYALRISGGSSSMLLMAVVFLVAAVALAI